MTSPKVLHFPDRPQFSAFMKPCRVEGEAHKLEVYGDIPDDIDGTLFWVMLDPQMPPFIEDDPMATYALPNPTANYGLSKYRNKYTDAVRFNIRSTANANVIYFNGQLLALKEDSPPYAMDPVTLETKGLYDFEGQLPSLTFTAHPKIDPDTGEMICFGYEAKGDGTPDICYYQVGPDGGFSDICWLVAPVCAMIHDFAVTENWWLRWNNSFPGHTLNAYENEKGNIIVDLGISQQNVFFWWPDSKGSAPEPSTITSQLMRFTINPNTTTETLSDPEVLHTGNSKFYRIDDRFATRKHNHCFFDLMDPSLGTDFESIAPRLGGGYPLYNALAHLDLLTRETKVYFPGKTHLVQEPVFIPKAGSPVEGDGYLLALVNNYNTMASELHLLDLKDPTTARAVIKLPVRLRPGLHGNWVDSGDMSSKIGVSTI
ncbi:lignostilbene dioxygenase [Aspergillus sclerotioniger CBS 115572]|uniref:Lignostilbene dioxygenase n=1 Tax=Aspergillus sclerotioniger CBS 115572 TaxID=1450535 RepID=A0A317WZ86_9EURO|nr:lignostilbene dioxygenase [Aspergillus sclerotioniger CBS 115572]PWY91694.1 lignostilbene dioxygenase [Aspergillus sclerotioniger CBS 115572]